MVLDVFVRRSVGFCLPAKHPIGYTVAIKSLLEGLSCIILMLKALQEALFDMMFLTGERKGLPQTKGFLSV